MAGADEMKVATEEGKLLTGLLGVLGIFSLLRTFTDFEVTTCMMLSVPVLWIVLAFWFWFKIKVLKIKLDPFPPEATPEAIERLKNDPQLHEARQREPAAFTADAKELGIDIVPQATIDTYEANLLKATDDLKQSRAYLQADTVEKEKMLAAVARAHADDMTRAVEQHGKETVDRITALREWRTLDHQFSSGRKPTADEKFRMQKLHDKAYMGNR